MSDWMTLDIGLCVSILTDEKAIEEVFSAGISKDMLLDDGRKAFEYIESHYREYGKLPQRETILRETGITVPLEDVEPLRYYIDEVKKRAVGNLLSDKLKSVVDDLGNGKPDSAFEGLKMILHSVNETFQNRSGSTVNFVEEVETSKREYQRLKDLGGAIDGIKTPWSSLSDQTQGWHPGELITVAGRLAIGKSWALLLMAMAAWEDGKKVLFISMEMPLYQIRRRLEALIARLPYNDLKRGRLGDAGEVIYFEMLDSLKDKTPLYIVSGNRISQVSGIELLIEEYAADLVVIDGVYLINQKDSKIAMWERMSSTIWSLKQVAERKKVPILVSTQLNRKVKTNSAEASVEHLAFSDSVAQVSDIVIVLLRDEELKEYKQMKIAVLKNREGYIFEITSEWDLEQMSFEEKSTKGLGDESVPAGESKTVEEDKIDIDDATLEL